MTSKTAIQQFLAQRRIAVVGISRGGKKFGNTAYRELKAKGYTVYPINPHVDTIGNDRCYRSLSEIPEPVDAVLVVVPSTETEKVVKEAYSAGIKNVWLQQGAESESAIQFCKEKNINLVYDKCVLMFAEPTGFFHRMHRWVYGLQGKLPN